MAWMALLVICTVTPEQSGWSTGGPTVSPYESPNNRPFPGTNPTAAGQPTAAPIVPDYAPGPSFPSSASSSSMPPSVMAPTTTTPPGGGGGSWWTQIQDALANPVSRTPAAGPSNASGQMRQASGAEYPPTPPPVVAPRSAVGFPSATNQNGVLPPEYGANPGSIPRGERGDILPPGGNSYTNRPAPGMGTGGREILYENAGSGNDLDRTASYQNKTFVTAPRVTVPEPPPLQPPNNVDFGNSADGQFPTQPLPSQLPTNTVGSPSGSGLDDAQSTAETKTQAQNASGDRWWPLLLAMLGLFGSLGFNVYLGWIAWDLHGRYQDVVADLHDLENQFDERSSIAESDRSVRRDSRRVTALAG